MKQTVFAVITVASLFLGATSCSQQPSAKDQTTVPAEFTISKEKLMDKIKGGWAGQTIGCTYRMAGRIYQVVVRECTRIVR